MKKGSAHLILALLLVLFVVSLELLFSSTMVFPDNWFASISVSFAIYLAAILRLQALGLVSERQWIEAIPSPNDANSMGRYQNALEELRFTKSLQWNFMYYLLASFGGLFAIAVAFSGPTGLASPRLNIVLYLLACGLEAYGIYFICEIQYKLRSYRIQISKNKFQKENYNDASGVMDRALSESDRLNDQRYWRDMRFILTYIATAAIAFIVISAKVWPTFADFLESLAGTIMN